MKRLIGVYMVVSLSLASCFFESSGGKGHKDVLEVDVLQPDAGPSTKDTYENKAKDAVDVKGKPDGALSEVCQSCVDANNWLSGDWPYLTHYSHQGYSYDVMLHPQWVEDNLGSCPLSDEIGAEKMEKFPYASLAGDPSKKSMLPEGAQCPSGFECLPTPSPWNTSVCDFHPTCFGQFPALMYRPVVYKGKYVISPSDQFANAHPQAALSAAADDIIFMLGPSPMALEYPSYSEPSTYLLAALEVVSEGTCPKEHLLDPEAKQVELQAVEPEDWGTVAEATDTGFRLHQKKPQCTSPADAERDVLGQYGRFVQYVVFKDFRGMKNCNVVTWTYCCGPVLMLEPEDIAALLSDPKLCQKGYPEPTYINVVSESMKQAGLTDLPPIYDWCRAPDDLQSCWEVGPYDFCLETSKAKALELGGEIPGIENRNQVCDPVACKPYDAIAGFYEIAWFMAYAMEMGDSPESWYYTLVPCRCSGKAEGGLVECDFDKPLWDYKTGEILKFKYRPPEELFSEVPNYQDGCEARLNEAFAPEPE